LHISCTCSENESRARDQGSLFAINLLWQDMRLPAGRNPGECPCLLAGSLRFPGAHCHMESLGRMTMWKPHLIGIGNSLELVKEWNGMEVGMTSQQMTMTPVLTSTTTTPAPALIRVFLQCSSQLETFDWHVLNTDSACHNLNARENCVSMCTERNWSFRK